MLFNLVNIYSFLIYFFIVNILLMYLYIITNQLFICIIIGLIYITAYSFLILLLTSDNYIWTYNDSYSMFLVLLIFLIFLFYSLLNHKNIIVLGKIMYINFYYSLLPNIYIYKLYIFLFFINSNINYRYIFI